MAYPTTAVQRFMHGPDVRIDKGRILPVSVFVAPGGGVALSLAFIGELAQSRIVSISRGSPPPEPR